MKAYRPFYICTLIFGLRENSRLKMAMINAKVPFDTLLLCHIADSLAFIAWSKTEAAMNNINRPKSILSLINDSKDKEGEEFSSGEDYERARANILNGGTNGD